MTLLSGASACGDQENERRDLHERARIATAMKGVEALQARTDALRRHAMPIDRDEVLQTGNVSGTQPR
ncbi:hypothetical protein [Rhizorhabdus argentea]|uniref:hypothetical protein n=1 Tax=Rhizorhabdus argentea TaxID=1387174 RepID=UPI0030EE4A11